MLKSNSLLLFLCFLFEKSSPAPLHSVHPAQNQSRLGLSWPHRSMSTAGNRGPNGSFQRVKRGWVWNQFFVLEEYMGSDPQYVGKVRKYAIPRISSWPRLGCSCNPHSNIAKCCTLHFLSYFSPNALYSSIVTSSMEVTIELKNTFSEEKNHSGKQCKSREKIFHEQAWMTTRL